MAFRARKSKFLNHVYAPESARQASAIVGLLFCSFAGFRHFALPASHSIESESIDNTRHGWRVSAQMRLPIKSQQVATSAPKRARKLSRGTRFAILLRSHFFTVPPRSYLLLKTTLNRLILRLNVGAYSENALRKLTRDTRTAIQSVRSLS